MKPAEFIFWIVAIIAGLFGGIYCYNIYTQSGYELGEKGDYSTTLKFNIYMETLTLYEDKNVDDKYFYETKLSSTYQVCPDFDAHENEYILQINDECFATTTIDYGYAECSLDFTFIDTHGNELLTDTLYINLEFYLGSTDMYIYTLGGYTAVTYWNYLFDAMGFEIRVYEVDEIALESSTNTVIVNEVTSTAYMAVA